MIHDDLINPKSILVVGGSNNIQKPGGKLILNLLQGDFEGDIFVVNPKESIVQGLPCFDELEKAPKTDLAFLAIPAQYCLETIKFLTKKRNTKAFIIISAGFGEVTDEGKLIEERMASLVSQVNGTLIGPNCIGIINKNYHGVFTTPIPKLSSDGCDLISSSGSTAVFIIERAMSVGLRFSNIFTVGNAAQTAVEDFLEFLDKNYDSKTSSKIKMIYVEEIQSPQKFLKHCKSLIQKGCQIAAIKPGVTEAGSRAASSHTGAMASSDLVVRALFRKAGIVYCSSRDELITVASIFTYKKLEGPNIAVITHAGGTAVLLTDALEKGGLIVPAIPNEIGEELVQYLDTGSSVKNPIDFLATGTADQLGIIIDFVEHKMPFIDGMVVVFGSPGLFNVKNVYQVLKVKMDFMKKPIFPVLPSIVNAHQELEYFNSLGKVNFPDEVDLGVALAEVYFTPKWQKNEIILPKINKIAVRNVIDRVKSGYLNVKDVSLLLKAAGIPQVPEFISTSLNQITKIIDTIGFPLVMKVVGPNHKTDVNGVVIDIRSLEEIQFHFSQLMKIAGAKGVLFQPMLSGLELFIGAKKKLGYGHLILFGLGGIFIEIFKDVQSFLSPCSAFSIREMLSHLKGYQILKGYRGRKGINIDFYIELILRLSALLEVAPEIIELDLNPLFGFGNEIVVVDARILIDKTSF